MMNLLCTKLLLPINSNMFFSVLFETVLLTYVLVEKYIQSQTNTLILGIEAVGGEGGCSSL